ncbi:MAG: hypothetical protein R6V77_04870 [Candidatus Cloacimonadaceae bacterium]
MKKVLFIAYYFPPMGGSGVQRSLKFVRYLSESGWQPVVLTVNHKFTRWPKDKSLVAEIPAEVKVYRSPTLDLNWLYKWMWGLRLHRLVEWLQLHWLIPDSEITWLPFAKKCIDKIVREHKIDLVYITGGPFSSMLLGPYASSKYNLKYLIDFRDEWTHNHTRLDRAYSASGRQKDRACESKVIEQCNGIIYAHPLFMKDNFESRYPFLNSRPSRIITNGFDETDFTDQPKHNNQNRNVFKIVYTGSFYDRRRPLVLLRAIRNLMSEKVINAGQISLEIYGKNTAAFVLGEFYNDDSIRNIVRFHPYTTHKNSLSVLQNADALLLYLSPGANSEPELPGKMFEYMRSYRPILAIVPPRGSAAELVSRSRTGFVFDSASETEVTDGLREVLNKWQQNALSIEPDLDYIKQFDRKNLTAKLAELFDKVLSSKEEKH